VLLDAMKVARPVWGCDRAAIARPAPQLVGVVPIATAILDHSLHHANVIAISSKIYRLRNKNALTPTDMTTTHPKTDSKQTNPPAYSTDIIPVKLPSSETTATQPAATC
jgi:hypothetical protein